MNKLIIKFTYEGDGEPWSAFAIIYRNDIAFDIVKRVRVAISNHKNENKGEWDMNTCLDVAHKQLKTEGYEVQWVIMHHAEIHF